MSSLAITSLVAEPMVAKVRQVIQANKTIIMLSVVAIVALLIICYLLTRPTSKPNGFKPENMKVTE
jgi:hypothetical protein